MDEDLKNMLSKKMNKAIDILNNDLRGLRTARASIHLLDQVRVEMYGNRMSISQVATISTPDAQTITVQVWDKTMVKSVEKAIVDAKLQLNPNCDGQVIHINLPPLSKDRRLALIKIAYQHGERTKIALRNLRRDGMGKIKHMVQNHVISIDMQHKYTNVLQKLTDQFICVVDKNVKSKESEIITI